MRQSQNNDLPGQRQSASQQRNPLIQRHPVLVPLVLFASSIVLAILAFFTDNLFPVLTLIGVPSALVCYLLAAVLGLCGVIVSITGLLELCDTLGPCRIQLALAPQSKGQRYDCN
jgi:anaerobic C4-dicarboxylate transporter